MPAPSDPSGHSRQRDAFEYAVVRVVPLVEREEFINAGIILYCASRDYLAARVELDRARLSALSPDADVELIGEHLQRLPILCEGSALAGPIGSLPLGERFRWLVAPRSTLLQMSPAHAGLCGDPSHALARLFERLVLSARRP